MPAYFGDANISAADIANRKIEIEAHIGPSGSS